MSDQRESAAEVRNGLRVGRTLKGSDAGHEPILKRLLGLQGFGVVLRQALRLSRRQFRKPFLEGLRDLPVIAAPPALQERRISGILNERVFEDVGFVRRGSLPVQNPRLNQLLELGEAFEKLYLAMLHIVAEMQGLAAEG